MKLSIIIPTHNRAESLKRVIESILALQGEADFEFVIVDNNSTDNTKKVVENYSEIARYVFEENTAFTKARGTGADYANGDIFLYLDDDVVIHSGALKEIVNVFMQYPDCGVIAGKILPEYEIIPPDWTLACQKSFNGWSLYNPEIIEELGSGFQEVFSAAGPMMAIRREAYEKVGGFPPDTIGVETNQKSNTFRKLYVGPGDYGLCHKVKKKGYKLYYSPKISCSHVILETRFSVPFWRSRMIGEGHHQAITNREFYRQNKYQLWKEREKAVYYYNWWNKKLIGRLKNNENYLKRTKFDGMLFEELWVHYYNAYLQLDNVLSNNKGLSPFLWKIGSEGVSDNKFEDVVKQFPQDFINLIDPKNMYQEQPITSVEAYNFYGFPSIKISPVISIARKLYSVGIALKN